MEKLQKKNVLGGLALIFAFIMPVLGVVFGIISILVACNGDVYLLRDGIAAIVISVVVTLVWILFLLLIPVLGVVASVALMTI